MRSFGKLFNEGWPVIGMVHLLPLPGTPGYSGSVHDIYERAMRDAAALALAGVGALIVENFSDSPYSLTSPAAEQLAVMAAIGYAFKSSYATPLGVNMHLNAWDAEIGLAHAIDADFVRLEVFVDTVIASAQGVVQPCAAEAMRKRARLGSDTLFFADIQTKNTRNLVEQSIEQSAIDATEAGADALIISGNGTGQATSLDDLRRLRSCTTLPLLVGSGTSAANLKETMSVADGAIVGSALKEGGVANKPVCVSTARAFMDEVRKLRVE